MIRLNNSVRREAAAAAGNGKEFWGKALLSQRNDDELIQAGEYARIEPGTQFVVVPGSQIESSSSRQTCYVIAPAFYHFQTTLLAPFPGSDDHHHQRLLNSESHLLVKCNDSKGLN